MHYPRLASPLGSKGATALSPRQALSNAATRETRKAKARRGPEAMFGAVSAWIPFRLRSQMLCDEFVTRSRTRASDRRSPGSCRPGAGTRARALVLYWIQTIASGPAKPGARFRRGPGQPASPSAAGVPWPPPRLSLGQRPAPHLHPGVRCRPVPGVRGAEESSTRSISTGDRSRAGPAADPRPSSRSPSVPRSW